MIRRFATSIGAKSLSQQRKKIVVTARAFDETIAHLRSAADNIHIVTNETTEPWSRADLISHAHDAHALLAFMTDSCDEALLDVCPDLELVSCALKGFDNFDAGLCAARGVAVTAVPDLLTAPTAELAVLLALGLGRRVREADGAVRSGGFRGWRPTLYGAGLAGAAVGVFGAGAVGAAVMERVKGFAPARIRYVDPKTRPSALDGGTAVEPADSLGDLLRTSDFLFVCTPLNQSTFHAINRESIAAAKPGMHLINISRGSCVDEVAVADALESGALGGYAADVFGFEDWILKDRPDGIEPRLLSHPRTLFTPHLGSAVAPVRREIEMAAANEIIRWLKGEPYWHKVN